MARMQSFLSVFALLWSLASAFQAASVAPSFVAPRSSALSMSTQADADVETAAAFVKPPRVIPDSLPTLYVYDHCPFCVRVRFALGLKNIKHNLHFLAN